jgi:tRNA pseudouridine55 synthase
MQNVIIVNKEIGETPLERLEIVRKKLNLDKDVPMTYAGRLDPMAEGLMVILLGCECKEKHRYTVLDKEYEVEILLGVETDSYDVLGLVQNVDLDKRHFRSRDWQADLNKYVGKFDQKYPRYSSKVIAMKKIPKNLPIKKVEVYSINKIEEKDILGKEIFEQVVSKIKKVKGDFRQKEIIKKWQNFVEKYSNSKFKIIKIKVGCSSGTYMRSIAYKMGGLAFSIKRIKIGEYFL